MFTAGGADSGNDVQAAISVFASQLTHVVLDVVGFVVSSGVVNPAVILGSAGAAPTEAARRREQAIRDSEPAWK